MMQVQLIREFASKAIGDRVTIARKRMSNNWGMDINNKPNPRLLVPSVINYIPEEEDIAFREDFVNRCPLANNFSDITLAILHELGHWATRKEIDWIEDAEIKREAVSNEYFDIPSEYIATEWAIGWLATYEHRKLAREFEAQLFSHN